MEAGDDTTLGVGISRYDCLDFGRDVGPVKVMLLVESVVGAADSALTPADARMLAAALVWAADRAEATQRRGAR